MKSIQPLGKWVLVNVISNSQSVGGIVLPEAVASEHSAEMIVEAVGDEVKRVKVGDGVVFMMQQAIRVDLPNVEKGRVLVSEDIIFAVLKAGE